MISTTGKLLYNPTRKDLKKSEESNIIILDLPKDNLADYYQWFIKKYYGEYLTLQSPMFGTHITVVRPQEVDIHSQYWLKYKNKDININYFPERLERHWEFWSLTVISKELVDIRKEFGLRTDFRLHITIGRQYDWQPKNIITNVNHDSDYL